MPGKPGLPHIEPCADLLATAEKHFRNGDLMATAVYVRAAYETRLKSICQKYGIKVTYKPDSKDVKADHLWQGIVDRQKERQKDKKVDFIEPELMNAVETVKKLQQHQFKEV